MTAFMKRSIVGGRQRYGYKFHRQKDGIYEISFIYAQDPLCKRHSCAHRHERREKSSLHRRKNLVKSRAEIFIKP